MTLLTEAQRTVLDRYAAGRTAGEIAALMKSTEKAVTSTLDALCDGDRVRARECLLADDQARVRANETVDEILARGAAHATARIRTLAERAATALQVLRDVLAEEDRLAKVRARVAELEAELARARRALTGTTAKPATSAKAIRAWAKREGIACPERGRLPEHVETAYHNAHPGK